MRALVLDGSAAGDRELIIARQTAELRLRKDGWDVRTFVLRDLKIAPCRGCFGCWINTPGMCVMNDPGDDIARNAASSSLWLFLTPVTFGGYSSHLKKAVDRLPPLFTPIFGRDKTDTHHKWRLKNGARLAVIGFMDHVDSDAEDIFTGLVRRNSLNFHSLKYDCRILKRDRQDLEIETMMTGLFKNIDI